MSPLFPWPLYDLHMPVWLLGLCCVAFAFAFWSLAPPSTSRTADVARGPGSPWDPASPHPQRARPMACRSFADGPGRSSVACRLLVTRAEVACMCCRCSNKLVGLICCSFIAAVGTTSLKTSWNQNCTHFMPLWRNNALTSDLEDFEPEDLHTRERTTVAEHHGV